MDKASKNYWSNLWANSNIPLVIDPTDTSLRYHVNRQFDKFFLRLFDKSETTTMRLLEVGCAKSAWLPYFAKEFDFSVCGLDYSQIGCQMAKEVLDINGVEADVICADLFSPPENMIGVFDVVVSFGVVEHFNDTSACIKAMSSYLRPGGLLITNIPNMVDWVGCIQKLLNKPIYDIHQLIDSTQLRSAHVLAGLEVIECDYFISTNFGVVNLTGIPMNTLMGFFKKVCVGILTRTSMLVWLVEEKTGDFYPRKFASPYINCIARKSIT
jgi:2-polyprenyl-3-methyl-5-hydroxy-6-metoxy-1,4-benzoquinol methylase